MSNSLSSMACDGIQNNSYSGRARFPSPYLDYTSTYVWRNLTEIFDWAEFSYLMTPEVREAFRRLVSPFVTRVKFESPDPDTRPVSPTDERKWRQLMEENLQWPLHAFGLLLNVVFYGNDFISVIAPIDRSVRCPSCGTLVKMKDAPEEMQIKYAKGQFSGRCVSRSCRSAGLRAPVKFGIIDRRDTNPSKYKIKHWSPRLIEVRHYETTEDNEIFLRVPAPIKNAVLRNDLFTLATIDLAMLEAIDKNGLFKFREGRVFHAREPSLAGIRTNGWGLPRVTGLHKQSWMLHLLRKSIQSIGLDLDHPIKVVSPVEQPVGRGAMSPGQSVPMGDFGHSFNKILQSHRADPTRWHSMPFPVNAQFIGGQANQLFPYQMMTMAKEDLVDAAGIPVEMYKGSLQTNSAPMGLRLFEVQNVGLTTLLNGALQFVINRVYEMSAYDPIVAKHEPVKIADDLQTLAMLSQLATSGQISLSEPLSRMGISLRDDLWKQFQEQKMRQEMQDKQQELAQKQEESKALMQQLQAPPADPAAQGGAAPQGGAPQADPLAGQLPSTGFRPPANLEQWEDAATALAQQLVMMPPIQKLQELRILKEQYKTFHSVVIARMENVRQDAARQGQQMILQGG